MNVEKQTQKYLVTGCAGFIANRVTQMLLEAGHSVVGIDNMNDYYDVSLKQHRLEQLASDRFEFHKLDLENRESLAKIFEQHEFTAVINLAARAGVRYSMVNPTVYMTTNAIGNLNLLEQLQRHNITKYILASTSSLYAGQQMPFVESLPVNTPISPYAASKKAAEAMAYTYHHLYGIDVSVLRFFTVYGPGDRPDMAIHRFIQWIHHGQPITLYGDGSQARDFTFVDDIARGVIAGLTPVGYEIMNLGGGNQPVSISEVIAKIETLLGKKAVIEHKPFHKADMKTTWADISKANDLLDWRPEISLDDGLKTCVEWFEKNLPWSGEIDLGV
jgi:nucleoside-diphosphate-sugar epimerase